MEELIVYGIVFAIAGIYLLVHFINEWRKAEQIRERIRSEYGKAPNWCYDERDYNSMKRYYEKIPLKEPSIDDITWTDLDMDKLFKQIKNTQSSIGDEYSYRFFRKQQNHVLAPFEERVQAMHERAEERNQLQYAFYKIGRKTNNGMLDLITGSTIFPKIPILLVSMMSILGIGSIVWMLINIDYGFLAVLLSFCASIILFYVISQKIDSVLETLGMFTKMIKAAKLIVKLDIPEFRTENETLKNTLHRFRNMNALTDFVIQTSLVGPAGQGGNIITFIFAYFGLYGFAYQGMKYLFGKNMEKAQELYDIIGYIELCISTASYRASVNYYCKPCFVEEKKIDFQEIYHPLLKNPVPNSHITGNKMMLTGSNASGKSTFAKTLAVNMIMGQLFNTCLAKAFYFRRGNLFSTMNLQDDITAGDSFYVAEVKSLKRLMQEAAMQEYSMLFMDEIFKGTNMVERIAAASVILKRFAEEDCFVCIATHDLEISSILGDAYENYHFQENITANDISFDYKLYEGITTGSNAIKLLAYCKYDQDIVAQAEQYADAYRETGEWAGISD